MKNTTALLRCLFVLLITITFLPACKQQPKVTQQYYFYVDQVYFKFKSSQLLNCLVKAAANDSCKCADKYWGDGDPKPGVMFPEIPTTSGGREIEHNCCPCSKTTILAKAAPGGGSSDPETKPVPQECPCPGAVIAVDTTHGRVLFFGSGKRTKSPADVAGKVKKELFTLGDKTFFKYSFPKDFSDTIQVSFRGADLGHIVVLNGQVEGWITNP